MATVAGEILLEAVAAVARAVAWGVGVAPLQGGAGSGLLGGLGGLGAVAGLGVVGAGIVIAAFGRRLLLAGYGIALGLDLGLALAVGSLGLFEDVDNVLALLGVWVDRSAKGAYRLSPVIARDEGGGGGGRGGGMRRTLLTTLPDLLMTVMVSPTPIAMAAASRG